MLRLCVLLTATLLLASACRASLIFSGNTTSDFPNNRATNVFYDSGNEISSPESLAGLLTEPVETEISDVAWAVAASPVNRSGWDMRSVILNYDMKSDLLSVGIQFYARAGDADGDGDAAASSSLLLETGGLDLANMTFSESIFLLIDPLHTNSTVGSTVRNFQPIWLLGKPPRDSDLPSSETIGIYSFVNMSSNGTHADINALATAGLVASLVSYLPVPDSGPESRFDFEFAIANFSTLPGIRRDPLGDLTFSFAAVAGSNADGPIEYDILPNYFTSTFLSIPHSILNLGHFVSPPGFFVPVAAFLFLAASTENGTIIIAEIVGLAARFPCPTSLDPHGACCEPEHKDFCGVCFGMNKNMSVCGVCFGQNPIVGASLACPATVAGVWDLNLVQLLSLDPTRLFFVESLGDIDGNGVEDLAVGIPGLHRGNSTWDCALVEDTCAVGQVRILLMASTPAPATILRVINLNSSAINFPLASSDMFGYSVQVLVVNQVESTVEIAIGAPGYNNGSGATFLGTVDLRGVVKTFRRLTPDGIIVSSTDTPAEYPGSTAGSGLSDAMTNATSHFGAQLNSMIFQGARVLLISAPRILLAPYLNPLNPETASNRGIIFLAVVGSGARVLGLRGLFGDNSTVPLWSFASSPDLGPTFFSPAFTSISSNSGDVAALALSLLFDVNLTQTNTVRFR